MSNRRILRAREPRDAGLISLEVAEEAFPAPASDEVAVRVAASVLDPLAFTTSTRAVSPEVSFSGVICELGAAAPNGLCVGETVFGIGPPADLISLPGSEVERLPADSSLKPQQAAAIPYLCSFLHVLSTIQVGPDDRILITGQPVIRHLSEQFVKALLPDTSTTQTDLESGREITGELDGPFDVLVHGVTDPLDLELSLSALREDGEAFLLVPPGPQVLPLDFYPNIHRSCLRLFVRRVGNPCRSPSCPDPGHPILSQLLEHERIDIEPVLSDASNASNLAGLRLEAVGSAEKLIAVAWP